MLPGWKFLSDAPGVQGSLGGAEQDAIFSMWFLVNRKVHLRYGMGALTRLALGTGKPWLEMPGGPQGHGVHCQALQSLSRKLAAAENLLSMLVVLNLLLQCLCQGCWL